MSSENGKDDAASSGPRDSLLIHALHTVSDFRLANKIEFASREEEWRAFVAYQSTALLRITGNGKYHVDLTISQRMALLSMICEVLACSCPHAEEFIDCSSEPGIKTTPGELLKLITEATFMEPSSSEKQKEGGDKNA